MAKSIYEILSDLTTTTSVPGHGTEIAHTLPASLLPTAEQFEDESDLLDWANDVGCLHAVMQKGVQKFLIDLRATFKACKKDDIWTPAYGQANVDKSEWKITERPGQTKNHQAIIEAGMKVGLATAKGLKALNIDDETILKALQNSFDDEIATVILAKVNENLNAE